MRKLEMIINLKITFSFSSFSDRLNEELIRYEVCKENSKLRLGMEKINFHAKIQQIKIKIY